MDLLASFYNGLSGVNAMGQKLNVTSNNIANVNTNAFKAGHTQFADIFETTLNSLSFGHGVQLSQIGTSFADGSIETTGKATDMAITGPGFFMVRRDDATVADIYTRSGNFNLVGVDPSLVSGELNVSKLVTPTGQFVQGYNLSTTTLPPTVPSGPPADIMIKNIAPQSATSEVELVLNLQNNPALVEPAASLITTLFENWNGINTAQPIDTSNYDYKTSLTIYGPGDETAGFTDPSQAYDLTVYFDATKNPNEQEFIVTCNPALDQRLNAGGTRYNSATDKGAGALLYGVLSFSNSGDLNNIQCWNVPPNGNVAPTTPTNLLSLSTGGSYYSFDFNFTGTAANNSSTLSFGNTPKAQTAVSPVPAFSSTNTSGGINKDSTWDTISDSQGNTVQDGDTITLQGLNRDGTPASYTYPVNFTDKAQVFLDGLETAFACTAEFVRGQLTLTDTQVGESKLAISSISYTNAGGATPLTDPTIAQIFGDQGASFTVDLGSLYPGTGLATTNYASSSTLLYQSQNGYGKGRLQDINVDREGFITGQYSNGQNIKQAQLVLANFRNLQGLQNMGDNNFSATAEAGLIPPKLGTGAGIPGDPSYGTVSNYSLEMSNVDLGREMVDIITTQRAFQANAKSISTVDELYEKLIQMIR